MRLTAGQKVIAHFNFHGKHIAGYLDYIPQIAMNVLGEVPIGTKFTVQLDHKEKNLEIKKGLYIKQQVCQVLNCIVKKVKMRKGQLHIWADAYE